jgi:hypothetical protein
MPADAAVQQQTQPVIGQAAEAMPDALDLLIWNGDVKWEAAREQLLVFPCGAGGPGGGRAEVGQDRVGAAWIGGPPL